MRRLFAIPLGIILCLLVGFSASFFQVEALAVWYPLLQKPLLMPPNIVFPLAWGVLYVCMGISFGLTLSAPAKDKLGVILLFVLQLLLNFMWSWLFFYWCNPTWGLIDLLLLDVIAILYMFRSYRLSHAASWLFVPYILWLLFATYLNGYVFWYN